MVGEIHVKAAHILNLRTAINNIRDYYNLPHFTWESEIIPGRTFIRDWTFHIFEIRSAIQGIIDKINSFDSTAERKLKPVEWLPLGTGRPRADVMAQLKDMILSL